MLSKALTVNFAHISAVGHAAAVSCRHDRWSVKAGPCYLTLGRVNDDHGGFDVVGKAGSSLFNLHTSSRKVRFVRAGLFCFRCSGFMSTCELRERALRLGPPGSRRIHESSVHTYYSFYCTDTVPTVRIT